jgi:hypothetical protein
MRMHGIRRGIDEVKQWNQWTVVAEKSLVLLIPNSLLLTLLLTQ